MSTGGTPGPGYAVTPVDTEGVVGQTGAASTGTANRASTSDTSGYTAGTRTEPAPPAVTPVDTSGTNSANKNFVPTSTAISGTFGTLQPGAGGTPLANPVYRAPSGPVQGSTKDTTRTDVEAAYGSNVASTVNQTGTTDVTMIGSDVTIGASVPAAPAKPTAVGGSRSVTVSWVAVANPANDPVRDYVIFNSRGGTARAPKGATSMVITNLDPGQTYTFQVAARNRAGLGVLSPASDPVRAYNPDEPDVNKPAGLDPANVVNPIYYPDGSIKGGTGGTNNAPALGAVTPGAAASKTVTVNWTAPTVGGAPTSYVIKASDGSSFTATAGATSKACVFAAAGASVTFTVQAINAIGPGAVSAPSAAVTVP